MIRQAVYVSTKRPLVSDEETYPGPESNVFGFSAIHTGALAAKVRERGASQLTLSQKVDHRCKV